jgi:hypothetical protein
MLSPVKFRDVTRFKRRFITPPRVNQVTRRVDTIPSSAKDARVVLSPTKSDKKDLTKRTPSKDKTQRALRDAFDEVGGRRRRRRTRRR